MDSGGVDAVISGFFGESASAGAEEECRREFILHYGSVNARTRYIEGEPKTGKLACPIFVVNTSCFYDGQLINVQSERNYR